MNWRSILAMGALLVAIPAGNASASRRLISKA